MHHNAAETWSRRRLLTTACLAWPAALSAQASAVPALAWPTLRLLDGTVLTGQDWQDRAAVVVFWATYCPFCRRHNEHVEKLHRTLAGKPMRVIAVSLDKDEAVVRRYMQERGYGFAVTMDATDLKRHLGDVRVIPTTVVVDRRGQVVQSLRGEMFEEDVLELAQVLDR